MGLCPILRWKIFSLLRITRSRTIPLLWGLISFCILLQYLIPNLLNMPRLFLFLLLLVMGCTGGLHTPKKQQQQSQLPWDRSLFYGEWTQPIVGRAEAYHGFLLHEDGTATSINRATLKYQTWSLAGDQLILTLKSIGNRQPLAATKVYTLVHATADSLLLGQGDTTTLYTRNSDFNHRYQLIGRWSGPDFFPIVEISYDQSQGELFGWGTYQIRECFGLDHTQGTRYAAKINSMGQLHATAPKENFYKGTPPAFKYNWYQHTLKYYSGVGVIDLLPTEHPMPDVPYLPVKK